jgi:3-hydroxybutyryl-CoA dehydratase
MNLPPLRTLFFEDLSVGMTETLYKTVSSSDVVGFAQLTGDRNPIHLSEHFAARTSFQCGIKPQRSGSRDTTPVS